MRVIGALLPSIGVGFLFWLAMRGMLQADRRERAAMAELDRLERAKPFAADDVEPRSSRAQESPAAQSFGGRPRTARGAQAPAVAGAESTEPAPLDSEAEKHPQRKGDLEGCCG